MNHAAIPPIDGAVIGAVRSGQAFECVDSAPLVPSRPSNYQRPRQDIGDSQCGCRKAMAIFERATAARILRDGTTSTHSPHDAAASIEAANVFIQAVIDAQSGAV